MKRIGIIMLSILAFAVLVMAVLMTMRGDRKEVSVEEANAMIAGEKDLLLLDVRTQGEFMGELGHLDHALLIPVQELEKRVNELDAHKDKTIIAYCRTGNRSGKAMEFLHSRGFKVVNMLGGMVEWNEKKLPVIRGQ